MELMEGEKILVEGKVLNFIITTHRVRLQVESFGSASVTSIMLGNVGRNMFLQNLL